jgi:hypothetical protein
MRLVDADWVINELNKKRVVGRFNTIQVINSAPTVEVPDISEYESMAKALNMASDLLHKKREV